MVLRGNRQGVEGDDQDDQPVEDPGLHRIVALPAEDAVPPPPVSAEKVGGGAEAGLLQPLPKAAFRPLQPHLVSPPTPSSSHVRGPRT